MSYPDDDWFQYPSEFNRDAESPGAAGNYNLGNIDNIPLNDDEGPQGLEFDLNGADDFQYDTIRLSPGLNGQHQPGTSGSNDMGGQFQNMHVMQNNDTFDPHMHPSASIEYNSFEMPTVISTNLDAGPYQDLGIDDPNSYYANQQPSTSQGNDMMLNENYDMMGQQTTYMAQVDQMNPSSVGNPSSHSGLDHDNGIQIQPQPPKPKPKKRPTTKKKTTTPAADTVGSVLTKANKMTQQMENNNENRENKVEARISTEDAMIVQQIMISLENYKNDGTNRTEEIANLEAQIAQIFSRNITQNTPNPAENMIVNQIKSMTAVNGSSSQQMAPPPPKKSQPKKKPQNSRNTQLQQPQQRQQQQMMPPPQAQMTPAKIVMEPPTTTMVPSNNHMQNTYDGVNENYAGYHQMDEQGTSHQQYNDFQQPQSQESIHHYQNQGHQQVIQAKVVPTMSQRTHNYRQSVTLPPQNSNGPGPSPQLHQPRSHENHQMEQIHEQSYHPQDHQRPHSRHVYAPAHQHHQDGQPYQPQQMEPTLGDVVRQAHRGYQATQEAPNIRQTLDMEPTLGDVVRKTQEMYQGQDAPNLRQQLISNVNASTNKQILQRSQAPTPSPGNFHSNNVHQQQHQQYVESYQHHSYPSSHDMQPSSQSQQGYDNHHQYEPVDSFYDANQGRSQEPQMIQMRPEVQQHQQYEQREMYAPIQEPEPMTEEPEMYYVEVPVRTAEASKEKLEERLEEKKLVRVEKVKELMEDQLNQLDGGIDVTPFRDKMDMLERMLPFHHLSVGEEPVPKFDAVYQKTMLNAFSHANALGNRIRNIVLRDTMRSSTEWEENMLLYLETESERRKLEEDQKLAGQDLHSFLHNSDIIQNVRSRKLSLERSRQSAPPIPEHLKDLNLRPGELTAVYKEYEFDSYDENRPRGSPFVFEPQLESESDPELEEEEEDVDEKEREQPTRSDISPLAGFNQPSPIPSPSRDRNESESTFDWKDDDESPLLSPETEIYKKVTDELFGTQEDLEKSEPFPFKEISAAARKQQEILHQSRISESVGSSAGSSSTSGSTPRENEYSTTKFRSPKPSILSAIEHPVRSLSPKVLEVQVPLPITQRIRPINLDEGSPEIGDDYSMSPEPTPPPPPTKPKRSRKTKHVPKAEDIAPIPLPVPLNQIKPEKDDVASKLKLRIPVSVFQKGIEMAASEDDDDDDEDLNVPKESLKVKLNLSKLKKEDEHASRPNSCSGTVTPLIDSAIESEEKNANDSETSVKASNNDTAVFKTPLPTPLKADKRKRRSDRIDDSSPQSKKFKDPSNFVTPKNGLTASEEAPIGRFLRTMTDGRKIIMKIGKIPSNINHFVTPRRDKKGNLHKDLSPTPNTRLKMRIFKRNGELAVEVTEHFPNTSKDDRADHSDTPVPSEPGTSNAMVTTPVVGTSMSVKGRPAPASRKSSIDSAGKDKKSGLAKSKIAYTNRFNPFANIPSSEPSATVISLSSKPSPSTVHGSSRSSNISSSSRPGMSVNTSLSKSSTSAVSTACKSSSSNVPFAVRTPSLAATSLKTVPPLKPNPALPRTPAMPSGSSLSGLPKVSTPTSSGMNLIKTTSIVPKITVTNSAPEKILETNQTIDTKSNISSLLPWMFNTNNSSDPKPTPVKPQQIPKLNTVDSISAVKETLKVSTDRLQEHPNSTQQESPRASSSLSMSFFEDDKGNGFPFLHSPKRTSEPLPVVEFSDDEEDDLVHSTFSHATDHLLGTSKMNKPVNGAAPFLPWSTDP